MSICLGPLANKSSVIEFSYWRKRRRSTQQPYRSTAIEALTSTLPSVKSQKQYPLRLPPFFDIAGVSGSSIGERADHFVQKSRENPQWAYDVLIKYVNHGKQRVNIKKILLLALCKLFLILFSYSMSTTIWGPLLLLFQ